MKKYAVASTIFFIATHLQAANIGKPAPSFSLTNSQKQVRTLKNYRNKIVFINFWASWCAPCQQELPALDQLAADFKGKKVRIIAINVDQDRMKAKKLLAKLHLSSTHAEILWDPKSKAVSAYNIETMPSSFILDQNGVIRFTHSGFHAQDPVAWREELNGLLTAPKSNSLESSGQTH
jgi:DsbE subfamily thiol:disulfide oxidoreductase